jgi:hypothetical protein
MPQLIVHQPRVAWEGARAFVRAAAGPDADAFADQVVSRLGASFYGEFADTRQRLLAAELATGGDRFASDVESGKWRVRFDDLLRTRPDLTATLQELTAQAPLR